MSPGACAVAWFGSLVGREFAQTLGTRVLFSVLRLVKTLYMVPNDVS